MRGHVGKRRKLSQGHSEWIDNVPRPKGPLLPIHCWAIEIPLGRQVYTRYLNRVAADDDATSLFPSQLANGVDKSQYVVPWSLRLDDVGRHEDRPVVGGDGSKSLNLSTHVIGRSERQ